ncbi:MAG: hypothetical protein ALECFALPRED_010337 [Alectoria fallacina]|uniref:Uncharacterized protein n=1 Tax=Alectoria fallacina TaxID=1903189 RepID=A0A8H3F262_9LECA|nr:MAG: hypothetical protein ALECFALPRED_010337 [Alectoria fallacina]
MSHRWQQRHEKYEAIMTDGVPFEIGMNDRSMTQAGAQEHAGKCEEPTTFPFHDATDEDLGAGKEATNRFRTEWEYMSDSFSLLKEYVLISIAGHCAVRALNAAEK